jgi:chorismate dehydratase
MKRFISSAQQTLSMNYYKGVPSKINHKFLSRKVDAAFISSIHAKKYQHVDLGIIAKKEVQSVIIIPHAKDISDTESATSNVLARVLKLHGEVLIGDKALRYFLEGKPHIDLAKEWNSRYNLPFVFALLCYRKDASTYKKIQNNFLKQKVKIPQYILRQASKRTQIPEKEILKYLERISYRFDAKAKLGLKKFYQTAQ